jgi:hypothetical protein
LIVALGWLMFARKALAGTTLRSAWWWAVFSCVGLVGSEVYWASSSMEPATAMHIRYLAATTTLCPMMAVLGARRPHDKAWQWVVVALLLVLWLPALESLAFRPAGLLELHAVPRWLFLCPLWLLGLISYLPTRFWLAAILAASGQAWLLLPVFPELRGIADLAALDAQAQPTMGVSLCLAAGLLWRPWSRGLWPAAQPLDRAWCEFRDVFGALWAMRVALRFNLTAAACGWNVTLRWSGLRAADGSRLSTLPPEVALGVRQVLQSLLWRFVTADWLTARLDAEPPPN